jgi:hypothetical protein
MTQGNLFPVKIRACDPANLGSADAALTGMGDDGHDYVIKTVEKTPGAPAAEWFCQSLCELCGIAVPKFSVVKIDGYKSAFGSRYDDAARTNQMLASQILSGTIKANILAERLSAIYAFDLFVNNDDRHIGNYLFTKGIKDNYSVLAYDFSRAWTHHRWPLPQLPMTTCNTITVLRLWEQQNPFDAVAASTLLDKIETIGVPLIQDIYRKMPPQWLLKTEVNAIVKWWAQGGRAARINQIREGIKNGSFI